MRFVTSSVRSTRVPTGPLKLIRNWLSSVGGKNSVPTLPTSPIEATKKTRIPTITLPRFRSTQWSERA